MDSGSGFCREQRSRSPFFREFDAAAEWHCRQQQGYSHLDHSVMHHQMHSRMFMEKIEPSSSGADQFLRPPPPPPPPHPPCSCYSCSMARHSSSSGSRPPQPDPLCYKPQEFMGKPCVAAEGSSAGMQSPCFSIRTPLRKDARMIPSCTTDRGWMWYGSHNPGMRSTQSSQNQINLHKWFLVRLADSEVSPVAVGGFVSCGYDMELVKTGPIVDRIDKVKLRTRDGVDVRLMGCIDEEATIAHGFSGFVTQFFFTGFPCTWRTIIGSEAINERCLPDNTDKASTPVADLKVQSKNTASEAFQDACPETPVATIPGVKPVSEEEVLLGCTKEVIHTVEAACMSTPASDRGKETLDESAAEDRAQTAPVPKRPQARKRVTNRLPTRCSKRLKDKDSQESDGSNDSRGKGDGDQEAGRKGDADTDREEVVKEAVLVDNVAAPSSIPTPSGEKVPDVPTPSSPVARVAETEDNNVAGISEIPEPEPLVEVTNPVVAEVAAPEDAPAAPSRAPPSTNRKRPRRALSRGSRKRKTSARKMVEVAPSVASEEVVEVASTVPSDDNVEAEQGALETVLGTSTDHENQQEANAQATETDPTGSIDEVVIKEEETEREEIEDSDIKINKRSNSKRATRARKPARKKESEKKTSIPVVQIDSDDDQVEPKTESKPVNQRGKRSALPPPLPASRVAKSEVIEAYGLKTSRSGRLLVPPLAYWRNQTLALDKDGGIIAIMDGFAEPPSDTGIFNFKPPTEKKRLQQKLCAAAATDSPVPLRRSSSDKGKKKVRGSN